MHATAFVESSTLRGLPGVTTWREQSAESKAASIDALRQMPDGLHSQLIYQRQTINIALHEDEPFFVYGRCDASGKWHNDGVYPLTAAATFDDPIVQHNRVLTEYAAGLEQSSSKQQHSDDVMHIPFVLRWERAPANTISATVLLHPRIASIRTRFLAMPQDRRAELVREVRTRLAQQPASAAAAAAAASTTSASSSNSNNNNTSCPSELATELLQNMRIGFAVQCPSFLPDRRREDVKNPQFQQRMRSLMHDRPPGMMESVIMHYLPEYLVSTSTRSFIHAQCDENGKRLRGGVYPQDALATFPEIQVREDLKFHEYVVDYDVNTMVPLVVQWGLGGRGCYQATVASIPFADKVIPMRRMFLASRGASTEGLLCSKQIAERVDEMNMVGATETYRIVASDPHASIKICAQCNRPGNKRCSGCKSLTCTSPVYYCSQSCQKQHRETHRFFCVQAPPLVTPAPCFKCAAVTLLACSKCSRVYCSSACYTSDKAAHVH